MFEGKVVVTAGYHSSYTAEAYDYHEKKWSYLPTMLQKRSRHASVSMGNKMFVIGGRKTSTCEVFDNRSRKFVVLKQDLNVPNFQRGFFQSKRAVFKSVCIGDKILVFVMSTKDSGTIKCTFDVVKQNWSYFDSKFSAECTAISCVKYAMQ